MDKNSRQEDVISVAVRLNLYGILVLCAGVILLTKLNVLNLELKYIYFLIAYNLCASLYNSFSMYLRAKDKITVIVASGLIHSFIFCVLNIVLLLIFKMGVNGFMWANVISILLAIAIMFFCGRIFCDIKIKTDPKLTKNMILYSFPLVFSSAAWWINDMSGKYLLTFFCGVAINGVFAVACKIPAVLSVIQTIFYNAWSISAIQDFDKDDSDGYMGNMYTLCSSLSIICASVLLLLNIPLAKLLYAKDFFTAWQFVPFLLLGAVFHGLALFEGCLFVAVKKTKEVSFTTIAGAIVNITVCIGAILILGAIGAAVAIAAGYFVTWLARTIQVQKIAKMKIKWSREILALSLLTVQSTIASTGRMLFIQLIIFMCLLFLYGHYTLQNLKKLYKSLERYFPRQKKTA